MSLVFNVLSCSKYVLLFRISFLVLHVILIHIYEEIGFNDDDALCIIYAQPGLNFFIMIDLARGSCC